MQRYSRFFVGIVGVLAMAFVLGAVQTPKISAQTANQTDNKALVKAFYDAYNAACACGSTSALVAMLSADYVDDDAPAGMNGVDYFKKAFATNRTAFSSGMRLTIQDMIAEGDKVAVWSLVTGTNTGSFQGLQATGKSISIIRIDWITITSGKVSRHASLMDNAAGYQQLGFIISPPAAPATATASK